MKNSDFKIDLHLQVRTFYSFFSHKDVPIELYFLFEWLIATFWKKIFNLQSSGRRNHYINFMQWWPMSCCFLSPRGYLLWLSCCRFCLVLVISSSTSSSSSSTSSSNNCQIYELFSILSRVEWTNSHPKSIFKINDWNVRRKKKTFFLRIMSFFLPIQSIFNIFSNRFHSRAQLFMQNQKSCFQKNIKNINNHNY